jgi:polyisoprenoid-binding protein YceI
MRHAILAAVLLTAACATGSAGTPAPAAPAAVAGPAVDYDPTVSRDASTGAAGEYALDPRHAFVNFRFRHNGLGMSTYRFDTIAGTLTFDPASPGNSSVNVTIAANSLSSGLLNQAGERAWDREMQGFIGAETTPNITFVSTSARTTGPTTGIVTGNLTMNGQTHPVDLDVTFHGARFNEARQRHSLGFAGHAVIDRTQWGVGGGVIDRIASRQIEIIIEAEFNKSSS